MKKSNSNKKKEPATLLGKSLIKQKTEHSKKFQSTIGKHVAVTDGGDATVALSSYLEGTSLDDFLSSAVLANREFIAEKERTVILEGHGKPIIPNQNNIITIPEMEYSQLQVPRRPYWNKDTTPEELNKKEKESFLEWRRDIAKLESISKDKEVTPFEKNLEVWRQLWRVIERSDVVIQIVDARNPLFYRSKDLEKYVKEVDPLKEVLLVVNKSDFLSLEQRRLWSNYFEKEKINYIFFSAKLAQEKIDNETKNDTDNNNNNDMECNSNSNEILTLDQDNYKKEDKLYTIFSREDLLKYMTTLANEIEKKIPCKRIHDNGRIKFGMVGFPNVGKSSLINAILGASSKDHAQKRVAVGATPGKTKHFQTMILSDKIMLCDCPGLVFPSFINSKSEMICCGVLPLSQLRDHVKPSELMCRRIPKIIFEKIYGIQIPMSKSATTISPANVHSLLETYALNRGFTTTGKSGPDTSRAARVLLKDYVTGKLLYCHPPPGNENENAFNAYIMNSEILKLKNKENIENMKNKNDTENIEKIQEIINKSIETNENDKNISTIIQDFDDINEDKKMISKRLKKHGKKGRKGRDKNPYQDDNCFQTTVSYGVKIANGKKKNLHENYLLKKKMMAYIKQSEE